MARPSSHGSHPPRPPAASHPPTGATAIASPRNSCVYDVTRLASEYQNTMSSATGESAKHNGPSWYADTTKRTDATITKDVASARVIRPRGSSRMAVRGLRASKLASTRRLNPIAALRAVTIAATIHATRPSVSGTTRAARIAPTSANGSAKTEWLTRTNDAYVRMRESI